MLLVRHHPASGLHGKGTDFSLSPDEGGLRRGNAARSRRFAMLLVRHRPASGLHGKGTDFSLSPDEKAGPGRRAPSVAGDRTAALVKSRIAT
jgi:hypothetical protein